MKLTIRSEKGEKVVDLKNDLQFNTLKGEQYVFSNGFTSYVISFKDNQESVVLTFNVNGKDIKIELNGIVPLLQSNVPGASNPTAIIINKDVDEKEVDSVIDNSSFNGSEIIDRLESIISKPTELGNSKSSDLSIITDYQSLVESLGASAAGGGQATGTSSNGSRFNSIFSLDVDSLNGIADTDRWENLSESISTIPVETGVNPKTENSNVNVKLIGIDTDVIEGETATYKVILVDDQGNAVITTQEMTVEFTYTYTTASGEDIVETKSVVIPVGSSEIEFDVRILDDNLNEEIEVFDLKINSVSNQEQFDKVTIDESSVQTTITDDKGPDSPIDEDVKATIVIGDAGSVTEANNTYLTYDVKLSNAVGSNVEITLNTTGSATAGDDYKSQLQYSTDNGTTWTNVPTTNKITLPANGSVVKVRAEVLDDAITESNETVILNATTTNAQITSSSDIGTGTINDDKGPDSPIDEDVKATIVIGDAGSVTEANATYLTYDVKLSNAVGSNVEITLNTTGSATAGDDYKSQLQYSTDNGTTWTNVPTTNKITLPANGSVVKVRAEVLDDAITESNETVILNATTTNAQITSSSDIGTGTINDDKGPDSPIDEDVKATIVIGDAGSVTEANNTYLTYDVKLSNAVGSNVEITLNTTGSATAGSDYKSQLQYSTDGTTWTNVPTTNKITLPANGSVVKVRAEVLDDAITESNETVILNATTTNAQITSSSDTGTGTINDDKGPDSPIDEDVKASIVIGDAGSVTEANNTYLTYDVKLSNAVGSNVEITLNTTGSATAGDDYKSQLQYSTDNGTTWTNVPTTNKITLPADGSVVKVRAEVLDDAITESNETVILNATTTNAQITSSADTGTGTINDDKGPDSPIDEDIKATIVIGDAGSVTEANNTYLTYDVKLSNAVGSNVEITLNTTGSATAGSDYKSQLQYSTDGTTWTNVPTTNKITLPANGSVVKVRAEVLDDAITESNETVILNATTTNAQITSSSDTGTGTINDDKGPDSPIDEDIKATIVIGDAGSVTEANNTYLTYDVKLSNAVGSNVEITLNTTGSATAGSDYKSQLQYSTDGTTWTNVPTTNKITLPANGSVVKVRAEVLDDAITESNETVILNATTTNAQITSSADTGTGTINDDKGPDSPIDEDIKATIVIGDAGSVTEANNTYLTYDVKLSNAVGSNVEITLNTTGSATAGSDYKSQLQYSTDGTTWTNVPTTNKITLPANGSVVKVRAEVLDDAITESNETVILNATTTNAQITSSSDTGTGTINDDKGPDSPIDEDVKATIVIGDAGSVTEANNTYLTYDVKLSNAVGSNVEITLSTTGSATAGSDYKSQLQYSTDGTTWTNVPTTNKITLPANGSVVKVRAEVLDDAITESNETVILNATTTNAQITSSADTGTGTINDDKGPDSPIDEDIKATIVIGDAGSVTEANNTYLTYDVKLSNAVGSNVEITLNTTGSATAGSDYKSQLQYSTDGTTWTNVPTTNKITLPANGSVVKVRAEVLDDAITESNETVILNATTTNAQITSSADTGTGTINDDKGPDSPIDEDIKATIVIGDAGSVTEANNTYLTYDVKLSNAVGSNVEITLNTTGSATAGSDYKSQLQYSTDGTTWTNVPTTNKITLPANGSVVKVRAEVLDDAITESNETVILNATTTNAQITSSADTGTGTINDNDHSLIANNNTSTATETGKEFISSEDESNDGLKAIGNVIADDEGSNPLFITKIKFEGNMVIIPQDGSDITIQGDYGTLTINKSGLYTYLVNENTTDSWNTDRTEDDVFTYTLSDGYNPDDEATLTVTVEGKNDASVINSVTGNNQGYKVVDGLLDVNGDGVVDTINSDDLTVEGGGITFLNESGDLNINMGTVPTSMTVEYNGGQAGYHNVLGYYTKDINGNIEAHIIYVENQSMVGSKSNMLGTLNNLTGEIGFFIIPNGGNNGITTNSTITFNSTGQMLINGGVQKVYYTDNNLNSDGLDHVVAGMAEDGSGLVIAFEDLQLGDRDYDDFVIKIKPCVNTAVDTTTNFIVNGSFEDVTGIDSNGNYLTHADISAGGLIAMSTLTGWELLSDTARWMEVHDGAHAGVGTTDGENYLDLGESVSGTVSSNYNANAHIGQVINGAISGNTYELSFDYRDKAAMQEGGVSGENSGAVEVYWGGQLIKTIQANNINAWKTFSIEVIGGSGDGSNRLEFKEVGEGWDNWGIALDNITFYGTGTTSTDINIINNINISDVDDANLESATVVLTNYKAGDVLAANSLPSGITATIEEINGEIVVKLTGSATVVDYETAIASLTFDTTSENRIPRDFEITVNDGLKNSNTMKLTLDIGGCSLNPHTLPNSVDANDDYGQTVVQGEITIDSAVSGEQSSPDITYLDDGGYVIVWEEVNGSSYNGAEYNNETERIEWATRINHDIFAQRFDKDGEPVGEAIQVNTFTTRDQHDANVTVLSNGRYLVTWTSDDDYLNVDNYDNASRYIKGRIYDENNNPVCNEFIVSRAEYDPIIGLPDGGFIVTWSADARYNNTDQGAIDNPIYQDVHDGSEYGIFGQRFDAYGNKVGESFQINTYTSADQIDSDIALDSNGNILVTWQSENQDGSSYGIYTQKFELTSSGVTKIGSEVQVNTTTSGAQTDPEITALPNGKAIITWENGTDIYAQILGDDGSKIGSEIKVTSNVSVESNPVVTAISTGFIITWQSNESGNNDIFTQQFNISGVKVGDAIKVNTTIIGEQVEPTITTLLDGGYIIAWQNGDTISAQRFNDDGSKYKTNSFDLDEDSSITITFAELMNNDTDPQGHTFKVTSVSNSQNGTAVLNDANNDGIYDSVKFTPNKDYNGSATFDYTITDEKGAVDKATVHLDVKPKGEPSIFVGTLCSADIKGHDVIVNEGEDVVFAVRVSGAENGSTVTLVLADGTGSNIATNSDYFESYYKYSIDFGTTWITVPSNGVLSNISNGNVIMVKTDTVNDAILESKEQFTLTATLNSPGSAVISDTAKGTILDNDFAVPTSTNDIIDTVVEDKSYILTKDDFGTYGNDITKVRIEAIPTNGTLLLAGIAVLVGQEISLADIIANKLVFTPTTNSDADSSFTFKVSDGTLWSNNSYETKMNIIAVADAPIANINVKSTITIDNTNVKDTSNGYKVTAYGIGGKDKGIINEISSISNTDHDGFGVAGNTFHDTSKVYISGAWEEIGHDANGSEELVVTFDNLVSTVDISFAWKHQLGYGETALVKLYRDGNYVDTFSFYGGSDGVDAPITITTTTGVAFDEIRFSAPNEGDDYLIHSISFTEVEANTNGTITGYIYNIDLSSALIDTDGSETLTVKISGVPTGATFNSANIVNNGNGIWEYTVPTDATSIDDTFKMTVPSSEDFALKVVSTSIESSNLSSATTDILSINDSDSIDLTTLINNNTAYKGVTDIIDITNTKANIMNIDMNDVIDLVDGDKQLVIKGDLEDKINLDTPNNWSNAGQEQLDGVNYNVYTGTGTNSTIKLLIEDDIDVKPDI